MVWRGKLLGGSIGMMFGPLGAAAGAAAGHFFVDRKQSRAQLQENRKRLALAAGAFYELAIVDNPLNPAEERVILQNLAEFNVLLGNVLVPSELPLLLNNAQVIEHAGARLSAQVAGIPELAERLFYWFLRVAAADANPGFRETHYALRRGRDLRLPPQTSERLLTLYVLRRVENSGGASAAAAVLGVAEDADEETVKKAYHALSLKYHPDRHADLPPEILELTAEKFKQVQVAYHTLSAGDREFSGPSFCFSATAPEFTPADENAIARCLVCTQAVHLPPDAPPLAARCPVCQARLAFRQEELRVFAG